MFDGVLATKRMQVNCSHILMAASRLLETVNSAKKYQYDCNIKKDDLGNFNCIHCKIARNELAT